MGRVNKKEKRAHKMSLQNTEDAQIQDSIAPEAAGKHTAASKAKSSDTGKRHRDGDVHSSDDANAKRSKSGGPGQEEAKPKKTLGVGRKVKGRKAHVTPGKGQTFHILSGGVVWGGVGLDFVYF